MNVQHLSKSVMRVFQTIESRTAWIHYMQTCIKKCEKGIRKIVCNVAKSKIIRFFSDAQHGIFLKKTFFPQQFRPSAIDCQRPGGKFAWGEKYYRAARCTDNSASTISLKKNLIISITYEWFSSKVVNDQPKFTIRHDEFINVVISCSSSISRVTLYYYLFLYVRCCLFLTLIYRLLGRFYIKECDVPPQGK